ncbi:hypothetical protein DFH28DRAFT_1135035 [Melampsora americana]|nr:hypothetical protein DFH28DRAFT_1135035 [Melampsora americana]
MSEDNIVMADEETDAPTSTAQPPNIASVIAKALKQQATQFEAIVGNLQSQIATMDIKHKATPTKEKQPTRVLAPPNLPQRPHSG